MEDQETTTKKITKSVLEKIAIYKSDYEFFTGKTSEINRTLALAGIAVIWIFNKTNVNGVHELPSELTIPLKWFVFTLLADLTHYFLAGIFWWLHYKYYDNKKEKIKSITTYSIYAYILHCLYFSKVIFCIIAYWNLLNYFTQVLKISIF